MLKKKIYCNHYKKTIMYQIHQISLSLPFLPSIVHTYILRSTIEPEKLILIDTGVKKQETIDVLARELKKIDPKLSLTNIHWIIPTHAHVDHVGGIKLLQDQSNAKVIMHNDEYNYFNSNSTSQWIEKLRAYMIPENMLEQAKPIVLGYRIFLERFEASVLLKEVKGSLEKYLPEPLDFLQTPGHTPGHIAILEPNQKIIFTGDTILSKISPTLGFSGIYSNPLKEYLDTLNRIKNDYYDWIGYPAHQDRIMVVGKRVDELLELQYERIQQIKTFLSKNDVISLPKLIKILYPRVWSDKIQRYLALMETLAYLKYFDIEKMNFVKIDEDWEKN